MKTLMAFSGGLDSTFLAYRILTETQDVLHLFWMDLSHVTVDTKDGPQRMYRDLLLAEGIVAPNVAAWLSGNIRAVTFEVVTGVKPDPLATVIPGASSRMWRVIPMLRVAADLAVKGKFERFIYARSPENVRTPGQDERMSWYHKLWRQWAGTKIVFEMPLLKDWQGRPHALAALPEALQGILLSCNDPKIINGEVRACGVCDKCMLTSEARKLLGQGVSPAKALDALLRLRKAGPYIEAQSGGDERFSGKPWPFPEFDPSDVATLKDNRVPIPASAGDKPRRKPGDAGTRRTR